MSRKIHRINISATETDMNLVEFIEQAKKITLNELEDLKYHKQIQVEFLDIARKFAHNVVREKESIFSKRQINHEMEELQERTQSYYHFAQSIKQRIKQLQLEKVARILHDHYHKEVKILQQIIAEWLETQKTNMVLVTGLIDTISCE